MPNIIEIRCPHCSAILRVKEVENIEKKNVRCNVCGEKSPFTQFTKVVHTKAEESGTDYINQPVGESRSSEPGLLINSESGERFQLTEGCNIIGRGASSSQATIKLPTDLRQISREHAVIDVKLVPGKGYVHTFHLYKNEVNTTLLNGTELVYPEKIRLKDGDILDFPGIRICFKLKN